MEDILRENTALQLEQQAREWEEDQKAMEDIPDKTVGILKFDFSILRNQIKETPKKSLENLFKLLPSHFNDKCFNTTKKASNLLCQINKIKSDTAFVSFNKAVKTAADSLDEIVDEGN